MSRRRTAVLAAVAASVAAYGSAAAKLTLGLEAVKSEILVGEPCVVVVAFETDAPIEVPLSLVRPDARLQILIDRGQGLVPHLEEQWVTEPRAEKGLHPEGRVLAEYVLSYDTARKAPAFDAPGSYRVVAEYRDVEEGLLARSNEVTVTVRAPEGAERKVYDALRAIGPQALGVHTPSPTRASEWFPEYPESVYRQELLLNELSFKIDRIQNGFEVEVLSPPPGSEPDMRKDVVRTRAAGLIPQALDMAAVEGPFQPNALLLLGTVHDLAGDETAAEATYRRIVAEFPARRAAQEARLRLGDTTPPTLTVSSSPTSLWPPNNKLVPITVGVTVSDDTDPTPAVKLVSVTCDDACSVTQDIAGAALNTDDRSFQLRATRKGGGGGRTYTITYSASDALGNVATAQTTVRVPHDQGR